MPKPQSLRRRAQLRQPAEEGLSTAKLSSSTPCCPETFNTGIDPLVREAASRGTGPGAERERVAEEVDALGLVAEPLPGDAVASRLLVAMVWVSLDRLSRSEAAPLRPAQREGTVRARQQRLDRRAEVVGRANLDRPPAFLSALIDQAAAIQGLHVARIERERVFEVRSVSSFLPDSARTWPAWRSGDAGASPLISAGWLRLHGGGWPSLGRDPDELKSNEQAARGKGDREATNGCDSKARAGEEIVQKL